MAYGAYQQLSALVCTVDTQYAGAKKKYWICKNNYLQCNGACVSNDLYFADDHYQNIARSDDPGVGMNEVRARVYCMYHHYTIGHNCSKSTEKCSFPPHARTQEMREEHLIMHASMDLSISFHDGYYIYGVVHRMNQQCERESEFRGSSKEGKFRGSSEEGKFKGGEIQGLFKGGEI